MPGDDQCGGGFPVCLNRYCCADHGTGQCNWKLLLIRLVGNLIIHENNTMYPRSLYN
jgi:hypothetical protein